MRKIRHNTISLALLAVGLAACRETPVAHDLPPLVFTDASGTYTLMSCVSIGAGPTISCAYVKHNERAKFRAYTRTGCDGHWTLLAEGSLL